MSVNRDYNHEIEFTFAEIITHLIITKPDYDHLLSDIHWYLRQKYPNIPSSRIEEYIQKTISINE